MNREINPNYWRTEIASKEFPFATAGQLQWGFNELDRRLQGVETLTDLPQSRLIDPDYIQPTDIIYIPGTGAILQAAQGKTATDPRIFYQSLVLGQNLYEIPLQSSGLNQQPTTFIYHNRPFIDVNFQNRLAEIAKATDPRLNEATVRGYIIEEMPVDTLWLASALSDSLRRMNGALGGNLMENGVDFLSEDSSAKAVLLNGVAGAGNLDISHREHAGSITSYTVTDMLPEVQTGFLSQFIQAGGAYTLADACAASGTALSLAEKLTQGRNAAEIFFITAAYPGPFPETQRAFIAAEIPTTNVLPYLGNPQRGYTEAQAGVVFPVVSAHLLQEHTIPLQRGYLIRTVVDQGTSKFGVDRQSPKETYRGVFEVLQEYYPNGFDGTMLIATHGVNTLGWLYELKALSDFKKEYCPDAKFLVTSTQPQAGHGYPTRHGLSLSVLAEAAENGILWGMARSDTSLAPISLVQDRLQVLRREVLSETIGQQISVSDEGQLNPKDIKRIESLEADGIYLCFTSVAIPRNCIMLAMHQGLGGKSVGVLQMPIALG